jgi:hypothetical protein
MLSAHGDELAEKLIKEAPIFLVMMYNGRIDINQALNTIKNL